MVHVERQKNGSFAVRMPAAVLECLHRLPRRLRSLLEDPNFSDRIVRRLFPIAYEDAEREAEYRNLLGDDFRQRKLESLQVFEDILGNCRLNLHQAKMTIAADHFHACLRVVNDMRLLLGTEVDIREDIWEKEIDPDEPLSESLLLLHFLSYFEESLLQATGMVDLNFRPEDIA